MTTPEGREPASQRAEARQMDTPGEQQEGGSPETRPSARARGKSLRVRVSDLRTGQNRVNVNIPLGMAEFGMKMAARFAPAELEGLDVNEMLAALKAEGEGKVVDVEDEKEGKHVEVFIE